MITIIDYGMGNLYSVTNAIKIYTKDVCISSKQADITSADKLVLPGVGAFKSAYDELQGLGLITPILDFIKSSRPFLGLCLGLQLLFTKSYEVGEHKGLGVINGDVVKFPENKGLKIPHMGWNNIIHCPRSSSHRSCPLLEDIPDGTYMYFVHSYYVVPKDSSLITTTTDYGIDFCSMVWRDNIYGTQFHPEKSQRYGLKFIENFVRL